jgi:nitroimidazol reductase NimA-like FMN-containing flavoprotein (pyridoxamine 5'-phosphate oxidase superfamily)
MKASLIDMHEFLDAVRIPIRIACKTETGWPMVVSLWFMHQDGLLYCATQKSAKIVHYLQNDARCAFEIAEDQPPYCGIRGQARARIEKTLGVEILEKLITRYLWNTNITLANNLRAKSESEVAIILDPMRIFTWDFSQRMESVWMEDPPEKVCP